MENEQTGAYVASIVAGSPAADAGLVGADVDSSVGGDIIVAFNGAPINSFDALVASLVTTTRPGDTATLGVVRNGEPMDVQITIGARPIASATAGNTEPAPESNRGENGSENGGENGEGNGSEEGSVSAGRAMQIAERETEGMLNGAIDGRSVMNEDRDGVAVWVVELKSGDQTAEVVIDQSSGDVLEVTVQ